MNIQHLCDFATCFNDYLCDECQKINWDVTSQSVYNDFVISIKRFYSYIRSVPSKTIQELINHSSVYEARVNFIQFNYTDIFDELIKRSNLSNQLSQSSIGELNKLGKNLHVHGSMNGGYPTIGVNDDSQIENQIIKNDPRIQKIFIKPNFLDALQKRDANKNIHRADALNAIGESTVICTFGVSMGDSDKYWWEKIGAWLKTSSKVLVIFDICGSTDDGISPLSFLNSEISVEDRRKEIIERFIRLSGIDSKWVDENPSKIIVELDSKMFSFKLPRMEWTEDDIKQKA